MLNNLDTALFSHESFLFHLQVSEEQSMESFDKKKKKNFSTNFFLFTLPRNENCAKVFSFDDLSKLSTYFNQHLKCKTFVNDLETKEKQ